MQRYTPMNFDLKSLTGTKLNIGNLAYRILGLEATKSNLSYFHLASLGTVHALKMLFFRGGFALATGRGTCAI